MATNIDAQGLYEAKQREFETMGSGSERFESDFIDAVNISTSEINQRADLETRISKITTLNDTVALSDEYLNILSHMVSVCLMEKGQRPARGAEGMYNDMKRQVPSLCDKIRMDILNQAITDDTTDTSDFVALGGLG